MTVDPASRPIPIKTWLCATSLEPESPETEAQKEQVKDSACTVKLKWMHNCDMKGEHMSYQNQMESTILAKLVASGLPPWHKFASHISPVDDGVDCCQHTQAMTMLNFLISVLITD
jgi:hypothetical protein